MELLFLAVLILLMAGGLASGFPVAFALPGAAILSILLAAGFGYLFTGEADAFFYSDAAENWLSAGVTNLRGIYWEVERDTLIAIPLFVFMGIMLQRSKIAEDLLITMAQLFGPVRGGLGISVVFVGALLAATTGILGATVVAMGLISLPAMIRNKYQNWLSTGTIAASGTLGQIIPPSIVLIILADQLSNATDQAGASRQALYKDATGEFSMPSEFAVTSTSAGDMFMGALFPGLILVGIYMLFILITALLKREVAPPVPFEGKMDRQFILRVVIALIPPLALIFIVLGSIITGVATVNQAGAVGAIGAMIMAGYRLYEGKRGAFWPALLAGVSVLGILVVNSVNPVNVRLIQTGADVIVLTLAAIFTVTFLIAVMWSMWRTAKIGDALQGVVMETAKTTSLVFIILLGAAMLVSAFRAFGGEELVREFLQGLPGGFWAQFIIVMVVIFLLGFFLDFIEIAVVVVPIVAPILLADPTANISAAWLGVMIGLNIQTSFLTPPFGFALFYLRGVAPEVVKTVQMYKGVVPFIFLQIIGLIIVGMNPTLVNYLPTRMSLTAETAPPPSNPRLQACLEEYVWQQYSENGDSIQAAIQRAQGWDLSGVPEELRTSVEEALMNASESIALLEAARETQAAIEEARPAYQPVQQEVRRLEGLLRRDAEELDEAETRLDRLRRQQPDQVEEIARLQDRIAYLRQDVMELTAQIPANWDQLHEEFGRLLDAENRALQTYRRTVDGAYEPIVAFMHTLEGAETLSALKPRVEALAETIRTAPDYEALDAAFQDVESEIGDVEGAGDIRTALSEARREMRTSDANPADPDAARAAHAEALRLLDAEVQWRSEAATALLDQVRSYDAAIRNTIGLRQQDRLPETIAVEIASCQAEHRDISLYF